jgi:hypothetical protein
MKAELTVFSKSVGHCVVRLFVLFNVSIVCKFVLPPGDNQIAVNKYIISHVDDLSASCFVRLTNQQQTPCAPEQLTVPNVDVDMAILRTVPVPAGAQICHPFYIKIRLLHLYVC